jgi:hypothetical protein
MPFGSVASRNEYDRIVGERLTDGHRLSSADPGNGPGPVINELLDAFLRHAREELADYPPCGPRMRYLIRLGRSDEHLVG